MKLYFFGGDTGLLDKLYESNFDGTLFLYNAAAREYFTEITLNAHKLRKDFKYMVAMRPYVISPQYLGMIHRGIYQNLGDILQINLISGYTKPEEAPHNVFVGDIDDNSTNIEKSDYLIKYLDALDTLKNNFPHATAENVPDVYVSTTNKFIYDAACKYDNKMIVPYRTYKEGTLDGPNGRESFDIKGRTALMSLSLIVRDTEEEVQKELDAILTPEHEHDFMIGTPKQLVERLNNLASEGIDGLMLYATDEKERDALFDFVQNFRHLI